MTHLNVGGGLIHQHVHVLVDFASEPEWTFRRPSQRSSQRDTIASTETVEAPSSNASLVEAAWITRCGRRGVEAAWRRASSSTLFNDPEISWVWCPQQVYPGNLLRNWPDSISLSPSSPLVPTLQSRDPLHSLCPLRFHRFASDSITGTTSGRSHGSYAATGSVLVRSFRGDAPLISGRSQEETSRKPRGRSAYGSFRSSISRGLLQDDTPNTPHMLNPSYQSMWK